MKKIAQSLISSLICSVILFQNLVIIGHAEETNILENNSEVETKLTTTDDEVNPRTISKFNMGNKNSNYSTSQLPKITKNSLTNSKTLTNSSAIGSGVVSNTNDLNVRSGPSTSYEIIGTLKLGDYVEILEKNKTWYKISFNNQDGYIHCKYVTLDIIEKGLDVSKWNDPIDWSKVKSNGFDYVIIRCGSSYNPSTKKYDSPTEDPMFKKHIEGASNAGLKVGVYWFSYAASVAEAEKEAQKCLEIVSPYKDKISYPIFFDFEYHSKEIALSKKGVVVTKLLVSNMADAFLNKIEASGYISGIYTNLDFGDKYFSEDILYNNNLWIAQYSSKCTYPRPYNMWQFTDSGKISGISQSFDMNYTCLKLTTPDIPEIPESNKPMNISQATVDNISSQKHTGKEIKPDVKVSYNGEALTLGKDYTIEYSGDIVNIGSATVIITGINNYTGTKTISFDIIPNQITSLTSSNKTYSSIKLSWDKMDNIDGYKIYKYNASSKSYKYLTTINNNDTTTYTDNSLLPSSKYSYKIRAYKVVNSKTYNGVYSNIINVTTSPYYAPKIMGLKLKIRNTNSLTISWKKANDVTGYRIYRYDVKSKSYKLIKNISNNSTISYTDSKLESATNYIYKIKSYKVINGKNYYSDYSSSLKSTTKPLTPSIKLNTPSSRSINLTWSNISSRTTGYKIYMSTSKNGTYSCIGSTKNRTFTKTKLTKNKIYYFKVRAYRTVDGSNIYSSYSDVKSIKCK